MTDSYLIIKHVKKDQPEPRLTDRLNKISEIKEPQQNTKCIVVRSIKKRTRAENCGVWSLNRIKKFSRRERLLLCSHKIVIDLMYRASHIIVDRIATTHKAAQCSLFDRWRRKESIIKLDATVWTRAAHLEANLGRTRWRTEVNLHVAATRNQNTRRR